MRSCPPYLEGTLGAAAILLVFNELAVCSRSESNSPGSIARRQDAVTLKDGARGLVPAAPGLFRLGAPSSLLTVPLGCKVGADARSAALPRSHVFLCQQVEMFCPARSVARCRARRVLSS